MYAIRGKKWDNWCNETRDEKLDVVYCAKHLDSTVRVERRWHDWIGETLPQLLKAPYLLDIYTRIVVEKIKGTGPLG